MDRLFTILTKMLSDKNYNHGSKKSFGLFFASSYSIPDRVVMKKVGFIFTLMALMARGMLSILAQIIKATSDEISLIIKEKDCALVFSRKNN